MLFNEKMTLLGPGSWALRCCLHHRRRFQPSAAEAAASGQASAPGRAAGPPGRGRAVSRPRASLSLGGVGGWPSQAPTSPRPGYVLGEKGSPRSGGPGVKDREVWGPQGEPAFQASPSMSWLLPTPHPLPGTQEWWGGAPSTPALPPAPSPKGSGSRAWASAVLTEGFPGAGLGEACADGATGWPQAPVPSSGFCHSCLPAGPFHAPKGLPPRLPPPRAGKATECCGQNSVGGVRVQGPRIPKTSQLSPWHSLLQHSGADSPRGEGDGRPSQGRGDRGWGKSGRTMAGLRHRPPPIPSARTGPAPQCGVSPDAGLPVGVRPAGLLAQ